MVSAQRAILIGTGGFGVDWWPGIEAMKLHVVALVEPDHTALNAAAERFLVPSSNCFSHDYSEWSTVKADFIIDASPAQFHTRHAVEAMKQGLDVLVVKPLALHFSDALAVVEHAHSLQRKLMVAQQKRFLPGFLQLRDIVRSEQLGTLGIVNIDLNVDGTVWEPGLLWRQQMEYPLLLDGCIHHFDLMRWVIEQNISSVTADSFNPPWSPFKGDACLSAFLETDKGLSINYRASWAARGSKIVTFFSGWHLEFENGFVELKDGEVFVNGKSLSETHFIGNPSLATLNIEVLRRFQLYRETGNDSELSGAANLPSVAIVEACLKSIQRKQKVYLSEFI